MRDEKSIATDRGAGDERAARRTARSAARSSVPTTTITIEVLRHDWVADWYVTRLQELMRCEGFDSTPSTGGEHLSLLRRLFGAMEEEGYDVQWRDSFGDRRFVAGFVVNNGGVLVALQEQ